MFERFEALNTIAWLAWLISRTIQPTTTGWWKVRIVSVCWACEAKRKNFNERQVFHRMSQVSIPTHVWRGLCQSKKFTGLKRRGCLGVFCAVQTFPSSIVTENDRFILMSWKTLISESTCARHVFLLFMGLCFCTCSSRCCRRCRRMCSVRRWRRNSCRRRCTPPPTSRWSLPVWHADFRPIVSSTRPSPPSHSR